jgi:signal transduction histidine kinase
LRQAYRQAREFFASLNRLSIKGRLSLLVTGLLASVILLAAFLIHGQFQLARRVADIAIQAHSTAVEASRMRETFAEIERFAAIGRVNPQSVERFRHALTELETALSDEDPVSGRKGGVQKVTEVHNKFEAYLAEVEQVQGSPEYEALIEANSQEVNRAIDSLIVLTEDAVYRKAGRIRSDQKAAAELTFLFLSSFILIGMVAAVKVISVIVRPLSSLAEFVDQIRVEDDIPAEGALPIERTEIPEIMSLTTSFEQLLHRLRGYRNLNVKRLLIEKRQAEIISASITDGVLLLRDDEILYLNPVAERILGILTSETPIASSPATRHSGRVIGRSLSLRGLIERDRGSEPPRKHSGPKAILDAIARTMPVEFSLTQDERKLSYLITATPISFDLVEQIEHAVGSSVDQIMDRFQANTLVVARDVTIVRESQEAKSHFLGTLSHEVKTPVTSLTMATRLLKTSLDQIPNPMHRSLISTCADDVDRLRRLLEDLLTVSRFDTLAHRLEIQEVDVVKLVRHAIQSFQGQAHERGVSLNFRSHVGSPSLSISMDATKITWAISNLLTNALRHTPRAGTVEVSIGLSKSLDFEFRVRDTGPGIERARQQRIFDKFNPFYDLRVGRSGSAGIGLAIAREIVAAHGGRIWVASDPGNGAEFCFTLPNKSSGKSETQAKSLPVDVNSVKGAASGASAGSG